MSVARPKHPHPYLFAVVGIPYGVGGVFVAVVMPFLAERAGFSIEDIGWFVTLLFVPPMIQFLYAPIVDVGPKRKHWLIIVSVLGGACFAAAFMMPLPDHKLPFLVFAFLGQLVTGLTGSCNGGLLALTMPDDKRGAASAALNIGNLSGGAGAAWATIEMLRHDLDPLIIGVAFGGMVVLPSLAILVVDEPDRERRTIAEVFRDMIHGVKDVLFSKQGLTGIALCIAPVGTAALANYFAGMR